MVYTKGKAIDLFKREIDGQWFEFETELLRESSDSDRKTHFIVRCKAAGVQVTGTDLRAVEERAWRDVIAKAHCTWDLNVLIKGGRSQGSGYARDEEEHGAFISYQFIATATLPDGTKRWTPVKPPFKNDEPWLGGWEATEETRQSLWNHGGGPADDAAPSYIEMQETEPDGTYNIGPDGTFLGKKRKVLMSGTPGKVKVLLPATPETVAAIREFGARLDRLADEIQHRFSRENIKETLALIAQSSPGFMLGPGENRNV